MTIFLMVLKIIGMILLILVGLLVLLTAVILFDPVRIKATGNGKPESEKNGGVYRLWVRATWLFGLIRFKGEMSGGSPRACLYFFWKKKIFFADEDEDDREEQPDEPKESISASGEEQPGQRKERGEISNTEKPSDLPGGNRIVSDTDTQPDHTAESSISPEEDPSKESVASSGGEQPKPHNQHRVSVFEKIMDHVQQTKVKIQKIVHEIRFKTHGAKKIITDDRNNKALVHVKNELIYLGRHAGIRDCRIDLVYSTGSPDTTGIIFGVLGACPLPYIWEWRIIPDFEAEKLYAKGSGSIRISFFPVFLVISFIRLFFDSDCRRLKAMIDRYR